MIIVVHFDAENERQIVDTFAEVRKQGGNVVSRLTGPLEFPGAGDDPVGRVQKSVYFTAETGHCRNPPSREFLQCRFVVEGVHLAHASGHEEENAVLSLARKVLCTGSERTDRRRCRTQLLGENPGQRESSDPVI